MAGTPSTPVRPITRVLADDPLAGAWERRRRDEARATKAVRNALPPLLAAHVAARLPSPFRLELTAPTGAVAAALRMRVPALRSMLEREGWDFRDIRVRVQPSVPARVRANVLVRQWDRAQEPALRQLEATLAPGPLKAAISGWLRRSGRGTR